jgi:hypothetical protein
MIPASVGKMDEELRSLEAVVGPKTETVDVGEAGGDTGEWT